MFSTPFLKSLQPFSTIRFVDWNNVINSGITSWQQVTPPTSFLTTGLTSVPYQDMIELCNEAQKDMWVNIPALATPAFAQSLAQLVYANLDPNLNVYLEYSDETWASNWAEYQQVYKAAQSNPLVTLTGVLAESSSKALTSSLASARHSGVSSAQLTRVSDRSLPASRASSNLALDPAPVHPDQLRNAEPVCLGRRDRALRLSSHRRRCRRADPQQPLCRPEPERLNDIRVHGPDKRRGRRSVSSSARRHTKAALLFPGTTASMFK